MNTHYNDLQIYSWNKKLSLRASMDNGQETLLITDDTIATFADVCCSAINPLPTNLHRGQAFYV
jgi:hypothetical protein